MSQQQNKLCELYFPHKNNYLFEFSKKLSFCQDCCSAILIDNYGKTKSTVKPLKYHFRLENETFSFLQDSNDNHLFNYLNYKGFIQIRADFVKKIKKKCKKFELKLKTYFLALDYFDHICTIFFSFNKGDLLQIVDICIILAAKIYENKNKAIDVKLSLSSNKTSDKYIKDEQYILGKLNYDLIRTTSYDILMDIMKCGFVFNDEIFKNNKLNFAYEQMENMLYLFSEKKYYIRMTPKEIAIAIMGFAREIMGLIPFTENIQIIFMNINEFYDIHNYKYIKCLNTIRKCFKIEENNENNNNNTKNNNHSDSTKDSNSDNNSEH